MNNPLGLLTWLRNPDEKPPGHVDGDYSTTSSASSNSSRHRQSKNRNDSGSVSSYESEESFTLGVYSQSDDSGSESESEEDASHSGDESDGDDDSASHSDSSYESEYSFDLSMPACSAERSSSRCSNTAPSPAIPLTRNLSTGTSNTRAQSVASGTCTLGTLGTLGTFVPRHGRCTPPFTTLQTVDHKKNTGRDCDTINSSDGDDEESESPERVRQMPTNTKSTKQSEKTAKKQQHNYEDEDNDEDDGDFSVDLIDCREDEENDSFVETRSFDDGYSTQEEDFVDEEEKKEQAETESRRNLDRRYLDESNQVLNRKTRESGKRGKNKPEEKCGVKTEECLVEDASRSSSRSITEKQVSSERNKRLESSKPEGGNGLDVSTLLWSTGSVTKPRESFTRSPQSTSELAEIQTLSSLEEKMEEEKKKKEQEARILADRIRKLRIRLNDVKREVASWDDDRQEGKMIHAIAEALNEAKKASSSRLSMDTRRASELRHQVSVMDDRLAGLTARKNVMQSYRINAVRSMASTAKDAKFALQSCSTRKTEKAIRKKESKKKKFALIVESQLDCLSTLNKELREKRQLVRLSRKILRRSHGKNVVRSADVVKSLADLTLGMETFVSFKPPSEDELDMEDISPGARQRRQYQHDLVWRIHEKEIQERRIANEFRARHPVKFSAWYDVVLGSCEDKFNSVVNEQKESFSHVDNACDSPYTAAAILEGRGFDLETTSSLLQFAVASINAQTRAYQFVHRLFDKVASDQVNSIEHCCKEEEDLKLCIPRFSMPRDYSIYLAYIDTHNVFEPDLWRLREEKGLTVELSAHLGDYGGTGCNDDVEDGFWPTDSSEQRNERGDDDCDESSLLEGWGTGQSSVCSDKESQSARMSYHQVPVAVETNTETEKAKKKFASFHAMSTLSTTSSVASKRTKNKRKKSIPSNDITSTNKDAASETGSLPTSASTPSIHFLNVFRKKNKQKGNVVEDSPLPTTISTS